MDTCCVLVGIVVDGMVCGFSVGVVVGMLLLIWVEVVVDGGTIGWCMFGEL